MHAERPLNIIVAGSSGSGSWSIRGRQLGVEIGAVVNLGPAAASAHCDVVVLVKRPDDRLVAWAHETGALVVYDVVDAWPQPAGNVWEQARCLEWLTAQMRRVQPDAIVAATHAMAKDCDAFGLPVRAVPHHCRPGLEPNPIRDSVQAVGYEGAEEHLGSWATWLSATCARRGWRFVMNPAALADIDIVVALREQTGYAPRHWKSGVKLANAQGSGTPIVCAREFGYLEQACGGERWADTRAEVEAAFDDLVGWEARYLASTQLRAAAPRLSTVASDYLTWLNSLAFSTARSS